jgi:rod shape-determining protein MreD
MLIRRVRLALVIVTLVVLQTTIFTHMRVFGAIPDLLLVATAAVAYEEGPQSGAAFGFAAGLSIDLFLSTPAGLSALAFAVTGYVLGVAQGGFMRESRNIAPVLGVIGGLIGGTIFVIVGGIVGEAGFLTFTSGRIVIVAAFYDAVISFLIFPFARWANSDPDRARGWN